MQRSTRMYNVPTTFGGSFFDSIFEDFSQLMKSPRFSFDDSFPPLNLYLQTSDKACNIEIALTGYKKDWLSVEIDGTTLTIKADVPEEKGEEKKYIKHRIQAKSFEKVYKIPEGYDVDNAEVSYEDGLLSIYIPVKEQKTTSKKLLIK